jgi:WXG100 family type VII secretion target
MVSNPDELAVQYGGLDTITTVLGKQAMKLEEDLTALQGAVKQAAEGFEGEAAEAFRMKMREWDKHTNAIHQALTQIGQKVSQAGGDYRGGDLKGASYFT